MKKIAIPILLFALLCGCKPLPLPVRTTEPSRTAAPTEPSRTTAPTKPSSTTAPTKPSSTTAPTEPSSTTAPTEPSRTTAPTKPSQTSAPTTHSGALDTKRISWGPGGENDDEGRPIACVRLQQKYGAFGAHFLESADEKVIYLTFDEGYENGFTDDILDTLKEKGVTAVFFITGGYMKYSSELVERMINEGQIVGNHTSNHPDVTTLSEGKMKDEIMSLHDKVKEKFGYDMYLFRPPEGAFSEKTLDYTRKLGYESVFWSYAHVDWDTANQPDPATALDRLLKKLHNGEVLLLHAVSETNAAILGDFIDGARALGYTFAVLPR